MTETVVLVKCHAFSDHAKTMYCTRIVCLIVYLWHMLTCCDCFADITAGIEKVHSLPSGLSSYEQDALKKCMPELSSSIQKGIDFAKSN